jgi:hypothetical protein
MLKSRTKWPPGGWRFIQKETGWQLPEGLDWHHSVLAIIAHRQANTRFNLSTDYATVADELDRYQCARLANDPNWCVSPDIVNFSERPPLPRQSGDGKNAAGAAKFLKNTRAGIKLWLEWFGKGNPVLASEAEERASICLKCPRHVRGNMVQRFSKAAVDEIIGVFEIMKDLNLKTPFDDQLNVCDACDCPMRAKVWCPADLIKSHLRPEAELLLWEKCWLKSR